MRTIVATMCALLLGLAFAGSSSATAPKRTALLQPLVTATLLGQTGEDIVGTFTQAPDGIKDIHIRLTGVPSPLTSVKITGLDGIGHWQTPKHANWWLVAIKPQTDPSIVDLYIDFRKPETSYGITITFSDGKRQFLRTVAAGTLPTPTVTPPPVAMWTLQLSTFGSGTGTTTGAGVYPNGTVVTLLASPAAGSTFNGWLGGGTCATGRMTMTANVGCTAVFTLMVSPPTVTPPPPSTTATALPTSTPTPAPTATPTAPTPIAAAAPSPTSISAPTAAPTSTPAAPTPIAAAAPSPTPVSAPTAAPTSTPLPAPQPGANLPEWPRVYVATPYVPPTGNVITVQAGGNLQEAINAANLGDVIELQAGATFPGKIQLPNKTSGTGWIIVRSSAWQSLPPPGTRVGPQHAALMAKITTSPSELYDAAVATQEGAHHYRFIGIEVTGADPAPSQQYGLFLIDGSHYDANNVYRLQPTDALTPHHIVIDRCYIHGTPTGEFIRGVLMDGLHIAIVDSYLSNFHSRDADTQAAIAWNTPGPLKLVNNYLEAAGENVMFGGAASVTAGYVPSDIEIRSNFFDKPLSWRPGDPSFAGVTYIVKNLMEFKDGQRALIESNVFGHHWAGGQSGFFFVLTPRGEGNQNPWAFTGDITFRYNRILKTTAGLALSGTDDQVLQKSNRILVEHNVFESIGTYVVPGAFNGEFTMPSNGIQNLTIRHNSIFQSYTPLHFAGDSIGPMNGFTVVDNIFGNRGYGIMGDTAGGVPELNVIAPGWVMRKNAIYGPYPNANGVTESSYPGDDYFPASQDAVGFVNLAMGDYHLAASSPYKNTGSDGKDVGADIDAVNAATACAMSGACGTP